jgi:outer membrane biosynthesis protein TonB
MKPGLPASAFLHLSLFGFGFAVLPQMSDPAAPPVIVPVELVTISEFTNVMAARQRRPDEAITPPEDMLPASAEAETDLQDVGETETDEMPPPVSEAAPAELAPAEEKKPEALPAKTPEKKPETKPEKKPDKKPETKPPAKPAAKPPAQPEKKQEPNLDSFLGDQSAFLDKTERTPRRPPPAARPGSKQSALPAAEEARRSAGDGTAMTASLEAFLKSQLYSCWNPPADAPGAESLLVTVRIQLGRDGQLTRDVEVVSPRSIADPATGVAVTRARNAVLKCERDGTFAALPAEAYDAWKQITFSFDPREYLQ